MSNNHRAVLVLISIEKPSLNPSGFPSCFSCFDKARKSTDSLTSLLLIDISRFLNRSLLKIRLVDGLIINRRTHLFLLLPNRLAMASTLLVGYFYPSLLIVYQKGIIYN